MNFLSFKHRRVTEKTKDIISIFVVSVVLFLMLHMMYLFYSTPGMVTGPNGGGVIGQTSEQRAQNVIRAHGFAQPVLLGPASMYECAGRDDSIFNSYNFKALNVHGETVYGHVCCNMLNTSCTLRF